MLLLWLVVVSYSLFAFLSESLNPFVFSKNRHKRYHKRLGVAAGCASMVSGLVAIGLIYIGIDEISALVAYVMLAFLFLIPALLQFKRNRIQL